MTLGKRPRQGNDVPISELALIVLKPITFTAFSNSCSFLCLPILLLLFWYVSSHGTRGFNLLGAKTPGTCKLLLTSMLPITPLLSYLDLGDSVYSMFALWNSFAILVTAP